MLPASIVVLRDGLRLAGQSYFSSRLLLFPVSENLPQPDIRGGHSGETPGGAPGVVVFHTLTLCVGWVGEIKYGLTGDARGSF